MPGENEIFTAIDMGTTMICTVVGRKLPTGAIRILGHSTVSCDAFKKGILENPDAAESALKKSLSEVSKSTGYEIKSALVGICGPHIEFNNRRDRLVPIDDKDLITSLDIINIPQTLIPSLNDPEREVLHSVKMHYYLDGDSAIRNPIGMHSNNIEIETQLVTGGKSIIDKIVKVVRNAGIKVGGIVLQPLASSISILSKEEKEQGAIFIDIGAGTTDIAAFKNGSMFYTAVIPVAGYQFTNDISFGFSTPYEDAESIKVKYGSAELFPCDEDEEVELPVKGKQNTKINVKRLDICRLIRERAQELSRLIKIKLDEANIEDLQEMRLVITGGTSNLPGIREIIQKTFGLSVRQGIPHISGIIPSELEKPQYSASVGTLLWAVTENLTNHSNDLNRYGVGQKGILHGIATRFTNLLPMPNITLKKERI